MRVSPEDDIVQSPKLFGYELIRSEPSGKAPADKKKPISLDEYISDALYEMTKDIVEKWIKGHSFYPDISVIFMPESLWGKIRYSDEKIRNEFLAGIASRSDNEQPNCRIADRCLTGMFDEQGALIEDGGRLFKSAGIYEKVCNVVINAKNEIDRLPRQEFEVFLWNALQITAEHLGKESNAWAAQNYVDSARRTLQHQNAAVPKQLSDVESGHFGKVDADFVDRFVLQPIWAVQQA